MIFMIKITVDDLPIDKCVASLTEIDVNFAQHHIGECIGILTGPLIIVSIKL